ncbi:unnamed protein product [Moneuplotes crassus]|uniref:non-specific serine/threonine protein kinase n=1 Tax=Euplotes crassus TaxID=5936 RepID=A0AAD1UAV2_EUPCR|nr:unnamed protein product [Moneuplotes crassus]
MGNHLELIEKEVEALRTLSHQNITKILDSGISELVTSSKSKEVYFIALELAHGGELFDFLMVTEPFNEMVARYFFRQLIEGLEYMHSKGYSHRDMKAENILFDKDFNLKIADFGTSSKIQVNKTMVGTQNFMAPEVLANKEYHGHAIDIFGAGLILFLMVTGSIPFERAEKSDSFYTHLYYCKSSKFWKSHSQEGEGSLSKEIKSLISDLFNPHPIRRLSISEIKTHPWYEGEVPDYDEILEEFKTRKQTKEEKELEESKLAAQEVPDENTDRDDSVFDGNISRGIGESDSEDNVPEIDRKCLEFDPDFSSHTKFFSTCDLEDLWYTAAQFVKTYTKDVTFSSTEYNLCTRWIHGLEDEECDNLDNAVNEASIHILKVNDVGKYCVEAFLLCGSKPEFHVFYNKMKIAFLGKINCSQDD